MSMNVIYVWCNSNKCVATLDTDRSRLGGIHPCQYFVLQIDGCQNILLKSIKPPPFAQIVELLVYGQEYSDMPPLPDRHMLFHKITDPFYLVSSTMLATLYWFCLLGLLRQLARSRDQGWVYNRWAISALEHHISLF